MIKVSVVAAATGFVLVALLVPAIKALCVRWGLYDRPGPLKIHAQPVPRLGGIAVTVAILGGVVISTWFCVDHILPLLAAIILICTVGVVDDIWGLSAPTRLAAQAAAGAILWYGGGRLPVLGNRLVSIEASCIFTVAVVNAVNFIDGADGIASGVAGIIAIFYGILPWPPGDYIAPAVAWALAGSCGGFLPFNFPLPLAKIFLGDGGSTVLGLCIAFLGLHFYGSPPAARQLLFFPLLVAGLPLLDVAFAVTRRIRWRASPFFGDLRHFPDLLRDRGCTPPATALICYGITAVLGFVGFFGMRIKASESLVLVAAGVGALLATAVRLGALRQDTKESRRAQEAITETCR
jgi:UDP-GlcNAc:undecaprenyl-phosphate/decaprenyl-phosphate GlcNAc-1-phosphate transferase